MQVLLGSREDGEHPSGEWCTRQQSGVFTKCCLAALSTAALLFLPGHLTDPTQLDERLDRRCRGR